MLQKNIEPAGVVILTGRKGKKKKIDISAQKERDSRLVTGRFNYLESPGDTMRFPYRMYLGDPVVLYELKDQEICRIPLGVARHLNVNVGHMEHKLLMDANGKYKDVLSRHKRCSFESLEFIDIEDIGTTRIEPVNTNILPPLTRG